MKLWMVFLGLSVLIGVAGSGYAQAEVPANGHEHADHQHGQHAAKPDAYVNAEIRKIDLENRKITLRHEAIPQFGMEPMTMAFRVADPAMLEGWKVGDKLSFRLERVDGVLLVTALQKREE